jgi:hypothetical protein
MILSFCIAFDNVIASHDKISSSDGGGSRCGDGYDDGDDGVLSKDIILFLFEAGTVLRSILDPCFLCFLCDVFTNLCRFLSHSVCYSLTAPF